MHRRRTAHPTAHPISRPTTSAAAAALVVALTLGLVVGPTAGAQPLPVGDVLPCDGLPGSDDRCEAWAAVHDPAVDPARPYQFGRTLAVSGDGSLVVAVGYAVEDLGDTQGQARSTWRVVAYDAATGAERWVADPGTTDDYARPIGASISADGRTAYVTGFAASAFGSLDADLVVAAIDTADGAVRWVTALTPEAVGGGVTDVRGWSVLEVAGGGLAVVGTAGRSGAGRTQALLTATVDATDGAVLGVERVPQPIPGGIAHPVDAAATADGRGVVVGAVTDGEGPFDLDVLALAVDVADLRAPRTRWRTTADGRGSRAPDRLEALALSPDGSAVHLVSLSGEDDDGPPFAADYVVEVRSLAVEDGSVRWIRRDRLAGEALVTPSAATAYATGVLVAGSHPTPDGRTAGVVRRYDAATGDPVWTAPVDAAGLDRARVADLAVTTAGTVVAVGTASSSSVNAVVGDLTPITDALAVSLDAATGERRWTARWNATTTGQDRAAAVLPGADGRVHVLADVTRNVELDRNFYDLAVLTYDG